MTHLHYTRDIPLSEANMLVDYINRLEIELSNAREKAAKAAETFHDFGPSTQCPNCHSSDHVLRCYTLGRQDAAAAIRQLKA